MLTAFLASLLLQAGEVKVWHLGGVETRVHVEQVGDEGQVQLVVAGNDVIRRDETSTPNLIGLLEHPFGTVRQVTNLCGKRKTTLVHHRVVMNPLILQHRQKSFILTIKVDHTLYQTIIHSAGDSTLNGKSFTILWSFLNFSKLLCYSLPICHSPH